MIVVPLPGASWPELSQFALTWDGYNINGGFSAAMDVGKAHFDHWARTGDAGTDLATLRTALFTEQRLIRWADHGRASEPTERAYIDAILTAIHHITGGTIDEPFEGPAWVSEAPGDERPRTPSQARRAAPR